MHNEHFFSVRLICILLCSVLAACGTRNNLQKQPNIVLIISDDQGYGDLGVHGNHQIHTPFLDKLHDESLRLTQFFVSPVCAPTRASVMTGRYCYRTGVVDTYIGRAMMESSEVTLAELLRDAGYRTGIFGKWHLGDTFPLRPQDQGFDETLVHTGGGLGQPGDPPHNSYFDPVLLRNGEWVKTEGYCTDIYFDSAIDFIQRQQQQPFFAYIATTAPHVPLEVDERYVGKYRNMGLDEVTARVYGMCENIDENVGRVQSELDRLGIAENTILIFMTDNGPQQRRYNAGMRGRKTEVWDGGIRVPFFIRWPNRWREARDIDRISAHIDILPTLLDACGIALPGDLRIDGRSLLPLLDGSGGKWPERTLFMQIHRGDEPQRYRNFAVRTQQWKLVQPLSFSGGAIAPDPPMYLFDMSQDQGEATDLSTQHPEITGQLKEAYDRWFQDVSSTRGYAPVRIQLGTSQQNPVILTPQDWRGAEHYLELALGFYEVHFTETADYEFSLRFIPPENPAVVKFRVGNVERTLTIPPKVDVRQSLYAWTLDPVRFTAGDARVEGWIEETGKKPVGVRYIHVTKLE